MFQVSIRTWNLPRTHGIPQARHLAERTRAVAGAAAAPSAPGQGPVAAVRAADGT